MRLSHRPRVACCRIAFIAVGCCYSATGTHAAAPPTSPATQPISADTLARGRAARTLLLEALERAYANGGAWPEQIGDAAAMRGLAYTRPSLPPRTKPRREDFVAESLPAATVVLEESIADHAGGAWVGFADGHLEFALDAAALQAMRDSASVVRDASPQAPWFDDAKPAHGELTLRVLDPDGKPVAGAAVGMFGNSGDQHPQAAGLWLVDIVKPVTDAQGHVTLDASAVFAAKFDLREAAPLYVADYGRGLIARVDLARGEFNGGVRDVKLVPGCRVTGRSTILAKADGGSAEAWQNAIAFDPSDLKFYTLECTTKGPYFEFLLPPGDYGIDVYGFAQATRFLRIHPTDRAIELRPDLRASPLDELIGKSAPELQQIKGWKNGDPTTLAALRGKVVLLDFWGHWCGPCVVEMPQLMKLHDEHAGDGLVVIAVHDDSVESIAVMDEKLVDIKADHWAGRDLPFLVALDGGGETRVRYSTRTARGATTAVYGISAFPTTLLIGRDGNLIGRIDPKADAGKAAIARALAAK